MERHSIAVKLVSSDGDFLEAALAGSPRVGVVYVPASKQSAGNLSIGLEQGIWGFSAAAMERSNYIQDFRLLREGDLIFLGHQGPSPRVKPGGWANRQVGVGHLGLIAGVEEEGATPVWPDGLYPYRLRIDFLAERHDFSATDVGEEVMEALRRSANQQGRVVVLPLGGLLLGGGAAGTAEPLSLDGPLDKLVARAARREQAKLRRQRLGSAPSATCDLCGRSFPVRYLTMAHIKKRSLCTDEEKLDPNVVMKACAECDALFEAKELIVDSAGIVQAIARADATGDLKSLLTALAGRKCSAFSAETSEYFEFHRTS